jgi:hypothetical protein
MRCLARGGNSRHIAVALSMALSRVVPIIKNLQAKFGLSMVELAEFGQHHKAGFILHAQAFLLPFCLSLETV